MHVVFVVLLAVSVLLLTISMINPGRAKDGKQFRRRDLAFTFGTISLLFLILSGITTPKQVIQTASTADKGQNQQSSNQGQPAAQKQTNGNTTTPVPGQPRQTVDIAQVKAFLNNGTSYYTQLFKTGQQALGTTQYADAYAGLDALNDPSSAASKWAAFNSKLVSTDYTSMATDAYNNASNLYTDANVDVPPSIGDWYADINDAYSDIGAWAKDATSWQISEIGTSQLNSDAQKFQQDIAAANADVAKL